MACNELNRIKCITKQNNLSAFRFLFVGVSNRFRRNRIHISMTLNSILLLFRKIQTIDLLFSRWFFLRFGFVLCMNTVVFAEMLVWWWINLVTWHHVLIHAEQYVFVWFFEMKRFFFWLQTEDANLWSPITIVGCWFCTFRCWQRPPFWIDGIFSTFFE